MKRFFFLLLSQPTLSPSFPFIHSPQHIQPTHIHTHQQTTLSKTINQPQNETWHHHTTQQTTSTDHQDHQSPASLVPQEVLLLTEHLALVSAPFFALEELVVRLSLMDPGQ